MSDSIYEGAIRDKIARHSTDSKPQLKDFSNALFETLREGLLYDGHVRIHQFGSFKLKWSNERKGKHPRTGEPLIIPAQPRISFTAAKALKDQVNSKQADQAEPIIELHDSTIADPETPPAISSEPVVTTEKPDAPAIETPELVIQQATETETPKQTTRMTAIAATIVCAVIIGYFIISPSPQTMLHTKDMPSEPASHVLATTTSSPTTDTQITAGEIETDSAPDITSFTDRTITPTTAETSTVTMASTAQAAPFFSERRHRLVNGDSLWRLSRKSYTNPFYWPHIYQANRSIRNPNKLRMGRTITLPSLYGSPDKLTAEDKRNIAEGYFQVYRYYKKTDRPFPYYALLGASKFDPAVIQDHIYEIDEQDWQSLQLASN